MERAVGSYIRSSSSLSKLNEEADLRNCSEAYSDIDKCLLRDKISGNIRRICLAILHGKITSSSILPKLPRDRVNLPRISNVPTGSELMTFQKFCQFSRLRCVTDRYFDCRESDFSQSGLQKARESSVIRCKSFSISKSCGSRLPWIRSHHVWKLSTW